MKSFVHLGTCIIALGLAGLLAGCTSYRSARTAPRPGHDFEVVETNSKRLLTPQEMEYLRSEVAKFLLKEGAVASGDYYVKVFLAPDKDGLSSEWVVVRFTRDTEMRYTLLGSYPTTYSGYRSYAAYDYYPYGYGTFGRISFQYYDDPFYGSHYYFPPRTRYAHDRNRDGSKGRDRDGNKDRDRDHDGRPNRPGDRPDKPEDKPTVNHNRWDNNTPGRQRQPGENNFPHRTGVPARPADRRENTATTAPARSESPRNSGTYTREQDYPHRTGTPGRQSERSAEYRRDPATPTQTRSESPARSNSTYTPAVSRAESSPSRQSAPSYSAPARTESSRSPESNQSQKEANQAAAQRERLE